MNVRRLTITCLGSAGLLAACNGILGIEDAQVDPTFRSAGVEAGSADTSAADTSSPSDATADGAPSRCEVYCATITNNCKLANSQYLSAAVCLEMCGAFLENPGTVGATSGNSLECRITHAGFAANDPVVHCPHAGVLGFGTCGEPCEGFCATALAFCKEPNPRPYVDDQVCRTQCSAFELIRGGETLADDGDSLNCRLDHLQRAHAFSATEHCPHIAPVSAKCFKVPEAGTD